MHANERVLMSNYGSQIQEKKNGSDTKSGRVCFRDVEPSSSEVREVRLKVYMQPTLLHVARD